MKKYSTKNFSLFKKITILSMLTLALTGCVNESGKTNKRAVGTVTGGLLGAAVGSRFGGGSGQILAGVIGAGIGAFAGNALGASMDEQDKRYSNQAAESALEYNRVGTRASWRNPDNGNHGYFQPVRTYQNNNGHYCREFMQEIVVNGKKEKGHGTACRMPDGSWKLQ